MEPDIEVDGHDVGDLDINLMRSRIAFAPYDDALKEQAVRFIESLPKKPPAKVVRADIEVPPYPEDTHKEFWSLNGHSVSVRKFDEDARLYIKLDNPLGPNTPRL